MARAPEPNPGVVLDWNTSADEILVEGGLGPASAYRAMAIVQTAVYEAVNAITRHYPASELQLEVAPGASVEAAIAAANHTTLLELVPAEEAAIAIAYQEALADIEDSAAKTAGITVGQEAAIQVLDKRIDDGAATPETYRPHTTPGVYVPTAAPAGPQWPQRQPWLMDSPTQFRPEAPPDLASEAWARDYNEVKALGSADSRRRSPEQSEIARFWEATHPPIYHGLIQSVASQPGRQVTQNARLFAAVTQAMDDALIAVMEAKYYYHFWRPVTAIRNGDQDGNQATERDPTWTPYIEPPMHPEYPCAHCILAGVVSTVLQAEIGTDPTPLLTTTSPTAEGAERRFATLDDFVEEVEQARIYGGVHYRTANEVGTAMGQQVGELAVAKYLHSLE
ncbi:vanadium-dependent haloperoxidase [Nodosilinea sp. P-1105]|uniref:vanadium-dependent haloperoxidase n=1 Tax=Nodosilinea sp. P-1105 TaxID=2546229 RepID=UPI00146BF990|nr:vanadium-dependent haloperoxidase [Nodosilinea sp. P-1105]NMF86551.1 phosphatase PAP2 family protein [Nodosilinea sp. P-1105]